MKPISRANAAYKEENHILEDISQAEKMSRIRVSKESQR